MIITGTTSMEIPSPLESPFTAYTRSDATYHAYFVFHTTSISIENSYLEITTDRTVEELPTIKVLKHEYEENCYVIDVTCPLFEYPSGTSDIITYNLTGSIVSESGIKRLHIDTTFIQEGCEKFPEYEPRQQ